MVAVAELADVITLTALAHGAGDEELADAVWDCRRTGRGLGGERATRARQGAGPCQGARGAGGHARAARPTPSAAG